MIQKFMKMMNKKNKGFTLVELMVVVVIIGILVAIAVPVYNGVQSKAALNAASATIRTLNGAVSVYSADNDGAVPADAAEAVLWTADADGDKYIQSAPTFPTGYGYTYAGGVFTIDLP